jgi:hypothetical protein
MMYPALNDGDDIGLKNLCTAGMYESLRRLAGDVKAVGNFLMKGQLRTVETSSVTYKVTEDTKSIRVVFSMGYATRTGRKIAFDVDFERIDNDLKVVRLRDLEGKVIAFDPHIDNYLNRRYGLPDGPLPGVDDIAWSEVFVPVSELKRYIDMALDNRNAARLKEYAADFQDTVPTGGEWLGLRASSHFLSGQYDDAEKDAVAAVNKGATVYFYLTRHMTGLGTPDQFAPVILGVSKQGLDYRPPAGQAAAAREEIPFQSVDKFEFEKVSRLVGVLRPARPFLNLDFHTATAKREKKGYNFAAYGTIMGPPTGRGGTASVVPAQNWERALVVVFKAVEAARALGKR